MVPTFMPSHMISISISVVEQKYICSNGDVWIWLIICLFIIILLKEKAFCKGVIFFFYIS